MELRGACIFGQSGGPTSVINASAFGVFSAALESGCITRVLGAAHGIKGVLSEQLYDISQEDPRELALLKSTPSSALGSCRYKLKDFAQDDSDYRKILSVFKKYNVRYFFYNGGNDSMDTCDKISRYLESVGYECRVIGVPKTIDNDLYGTDHCPGFGSAAKYIAASCMEIAQDAAVYDTGAVTIVECMGRNAGWLTAAASLASFQGAGPDLIYLPEVDFDLERFLGDVTRVWSEKHNCLVAVSEGVHDSKGTFVSEYGAGTAAADAFGHKQMGGAAAFLSQAVKERLGCKTRAIEFSLLQRCAAHLASKTDVDEAVWMGQEAVAAALRGESGKMVAIRRQPGKDYVPEVILLPLTETANAEQVFPLGWITPDGCGIRREFADYALPLIQGAPDYAWENGLPRFARLKKVLAK